MGAAETNIYNFKPECTIAEGEDSDTIILYLPGYTGKHLKAQLQKSAILKISGDNKFSSFEEYFNISENYDTNNITANIDKDILIVTLPKLIVPAQNEEDQENPKTNIQDHKAVEKKISTKKDEREKTSSSIHEDDQKKAPENMPAGLIDPHHQSENKGTDYKLLEAAESPASKLMKMARQKMTMVLALLFAFFGMCISKLQAWFFKTHHN